MKKIYREDTRTSERRIRAAIAIQVPDRVPVSPLIYYFAVYYEWLTNYDLYDPVKYWRAIDRCFCELGPWDAYYYLHSYNPELGVFLINMKVRESGFQPPPESIRQYQEEEVMKEDDYGWILRICEKDPYCPTCACT
ncbi:MAG: hypothetical protein SWK76_04580 [Actinomycetota bacterium]|nr:hypothetical protein [Actinomycetota bacterium]